MHHRHLHLPAELWWRIGVFANEILNIRSLCRATARARPERSVLHRHWSWLLEDEDFRDVRTYYNNVGEFLQDLLVDMEKRMWGGVLNRAHRPCRRALYARKALRCQRSAYTGTLAYGPWVCLDLHYAPQGAHAAFRLPRMLVRSLRRQQRWQALALIF